MTATLQRRSRSRRWRAVETEVTLVPSAPGDTVVTDPIDAGGIASMETDATTMAIEERTWRRGDVDVHAPRRPRRASAPLGAGSRYELGELIGRGGMGEVFAAYDAQIGREVAIKLLHPHKITPGSLARFLREARIQGWLDHPAIPSVYELGSDQSGRPFFVMRRLSGITLFEILEKRQSTGPTPAPSVAARQGEPSRVSEQHLLRAFVEIALAIEFAHSRGVLHRDLKPANILLGEFGEVYVLDWGLARTLDEGVASNDETRHTVEEVGRTYGALGTPGYMSPEQVRGEELDGRADVYALGCVLFEILTGRRLHPDGLAGLTCALAGITALPSEFRPDVAPELDELCRRATAVDRDDRIGSARALGEAVQRHLDGDRDLALRRSLAQTHFDAALGLANTAIATTLQPACSPDELPTIALHEAGRALALDPTLPGAAELVSRMMIERPTSTPAAVIAELEASKLPEQTRKAKVAIGIFVGYACLAAVLFAFGIRDVPYLCALVAIAAVNIAIASVTLIGRRSAPQILVALGYAAMFGLIARMFTPLFFAPGIAAVTLMTYAQHPSTRRRELLSASLLAVAAVLGVWGAEACGWISATTLVEGGVVTLVSPLDGIAEFPIIPALCCYPLLMVVIATEVAHSGASRSREARRELHVQAWRLRQLMPLGERRGSITHAYPMRQPASCSDRAT